MDDRRRRAIQKALSECFWGDYRLEPEMVEARLAAHDTAFERFLAGRIVRDASFASPILKALFPMDRLKDLLEEIRTEGRAERRRALVRSNILNTPWEQGRPWKS